MARVRLWGADVGAVVWDPASGTGSFEYFDSFIRTGVDLAPFHMPRRPGVWRFPALNRDTFSGLPGLLADSLPDRFGNALINAWLARQGRKPESFNPVERLCYIGRRGMGALEYEPASGPVEAPGHAIEVAELVRLSNDVLNARAAGRANLDDGADADSMRQVLQVGTSAGGARAKAVIAWNEHSGEVRSGQLDAPPEFGHWILKLDGITHNRDKEASDDPQGHGIREYIYYLMARDAGIEMSECRLFEENGRHHFMTRRFDRSDRGEKTVMQSLCALAHADYNTPGAYSYEELFGLMRELGLGAAAAREQFRRLVFSVLGCNRDDHTKNTAFLMDKQGQWSLSPAFDLTFAYNPLGQWTAGHQMTVNGKREGITRADIDAVGRRAGLHGAFIRDTLEQVDVALARWSSLAQTYALPENLARATADALGTMRASVIER